MTPSSAVRILRQIQLYVDVHRRKVYSLLWAEDYVPNKLSTKEKIDREEKYPERAPAILLRHGICFFELLRHRLPEIGIMENGLLEAIDLNKFFDLKARQILAFLC